MKKVIFLFVVSCTCVMVHAQTSWDLKKDEDGIKVYTGIVPNSNIKEVRVTCILDASLSSLTALLLDAKAHEQWVYNTKSSYLVKQLGASSQIYYSEISMPWPLTNRDLVMEINISQKPGTNIMYVAEHAVTEYVPVNKNKIRVTTSKVNWTITPIANNQLRVEYIGIADPVGDVPAWLVNSFSTNGSFETFKKLKELTVSPTYAHARYAFIKE
jgi:hypothetical protein